MQPLPQRNFRKFPSPHAYLFEVPPSSQLLFQATTKHPHFLLCYLNTSLPNVDSSGFWGLLNKNISLLVLQVSIKE